MGGSWHEVHDVVVVGSGAAALTGAYLSARRGWTTAVLERTALLGGTSAYSGGACWLPGSHVQQRAGIPDSTESARTYLRALIGEQRRDHQEAFLAEAPELVRLLEDDPFLTFECRPFPEYFDAPGRVPGGRSLTPADLDLGELGELAALVRPTVDRDRRDKGHGEGPLIGGSALIGRLVLALHATGRGALRTGTAVDRLVVEGDRVIGVEAIRDGERVRVRAEHGVLLAAGGFEREQSLRDVHGVPGRASWSLAPAGTNTGEVLTAALAIGAGTEMLDEAWWCPGLVLPDGSTGFTLGFRGGLVVDAEGRRFANESQPYDRMGRAMLAHPPAATAHVIFDARARGHLPAIAMPPGTPEEHLAAGTWCVAGSLDELAVGIGVPSEALRETVECFNEFARSGVDEQFHRGEDPYDLFFATGKGPNPALVPLDRPPYVAARLVLSDLGTKGGLRTDSRGRVLRADGSAVTGLYAAGNTAASMTGSVYPAPGAPIGTGMVFASLAVQDMAAAGG